MSGKFVAKLAMRNAKEMAITQSDRDRRLQVRSPGVVRHPGVKRAGAGGVACAIDESYAQLLLSCRAGVGPRALRAARELGRLALGRGLTVVELVRVHDRVCRRVLATQHDGAASRWVAAADALLAASMAPYENVHLALRAVNASLRETGDRYRDLFESADATVFTIDLQGRVTSLNQAGERLTGYAREEILARGIDALILPRRMGLVRRGRQLRMREPGGPSKFELDLVTRDGGCVPVEVHTRLVHEGGKLTGFRGFMRDVSDRKSAEAAVRHLAHSVEKKMKRIAYALHDETGQVLASLYLRVDEMATELPEAQREAMNGLRSMLDSVHDQLRRVAHELRPSTLDDYGLTAACRLLAEGLAKRARLQVSVTGSTEGRLPDDIEIAAYRVVQEALTNVAKHAKARTVAVEFSREPGRLVGAVRDDGTAFDVAKVMAGRAGRGLGLVGMQEHLLAVSGSLNVTSTPERGTSVVFTVPLEE